MVRAIVDPDVCQGHALCHLATATVFGLGDEDGHSFVKTDPVPADQAGAVLEAAATCPEQAISVIED